MSVLYQKTPMAAASIIGWDIGGAHLKAVQLNAAGQVLAAKQVYCPLWRGLQVLDQAFSEILTELQATQHVVTMTGELADFFENRHDGVLQIAQFAQQKLKNQQKDAQIQFYAAQQGFVELARVVNHTAQIASMNWFASVQFLAVRLQQALFIDIGSTTTDIACIEQHQAQVQGYTDAARMQLNELVYTGVVRTPLMALAQKIAFAGQMTHVAAEHFATTADVYTLTGDLLVADNISDTADGADKSAEACGRRLARMVGMDSRDADFTAWVNLANQFKYAQINQIKQAVQAQLARTKNGTTLPLVGCGAGEFLVREIAQQLGLNFLSVVDFIVCDDIAIKNQTAVCFPAFAVAQLGLMRLITPQQVAAC